MCEQGYSLMAIFIIGGDLMGIGSWVARAGVAATTATAQYSGNRLENGSLQSMAGTFAYKAIESWVSNAVQAGQQQ